MSEELDDGVVTEGFRIADQKIGNLLKRLSDKGLCPDCTARALACHAVGFAECMLGSTEAIEMFEGLIASMRENNVPVPDPPPAMH